MKNTYSIAAIAMLILSVTITYLGLQFENIFNPPVVTGLGFAVIAIVFFMASKKSNV
jgi:FtsH-binding integral membrane protein